MILRLRLTKWLIGLFFIQVSALYAQTHALRFKHITSQQGLLANRTTAVMQDAKGILWVGNRIAINQFDGEVAKVYEVGRNNNINQFFEDVHKNIWVGTEYGLYFLDRNTDHFVKVISPVKKANQLLSTNILCITASQGNELLISGMKDFVVRMKVDRKGQIIASSITILSLPKDKGYVTKIVKGRDARFWLATDQGEILNLANNVVTVTGFVQSGKAAFINDMSMDPFGNLWVATNGNGLYRYTIKNNTNLHFDKGEKSNGQTINNNVVTRVYTEGKNVWIGTDGGGLNLYVQDKKSFDYYMFDFGNEYSISDNSIIDIQPALNGAILLGTVHGGVSIFRKNYKIENIPAKNFQFLTQDPQGSKVIEDSDQNIWLTAGRTGLRRYNPRTKSLSVFLDNGSSTGFKGDIVLSLFEDSAKRVWSGTLREGVNVYDLRRGQFLALAGARDVKGVFSIAEDADGNIWVGHRAGIHVYNKELRLINKIVLSSNRLSNSNQVICIYKDIAGSMWIGTIDGLFRFEKKGSGFVKFSYKHVEGNTNSLVGNNILSIGETDDFSILIGTYGYGLTKYIRKTGKFEKIVNGENIKGALIRGIVKDNQKNIWLSTNVGLTKIDLKNNITNFGIADGVFPFNGGAASLDAKGQIMMAGVFGLSYFNPEKLQDVNYFPHVYFTSVNSVNEKNESTSSFSEIADDTVVIEAGSKLVNVNFSSAELYSRSSIKYQFLMVGLDDNWQNLGSQNKISFSNLDPGTYQLKVRATNNAQLWSSKYSTLEIVVKPTFWQRTIVKIFLFAGFIWMLIFVYRLRTSTIQLQREKLQKLLDLKTIEVKEQEQRISQDKISMLEFEKQNQTLKQRKLEDELNFKIDELTNNTLRAMHKNNLLTDIKDKLKTELKNKSIDKKSLENIVDHINDSFILDADWESFYSLFNQVHPTFIKSLKHKYPNLSEREIRLCALILIDFSSQHIATLFGISLTSVKVARHRLRKKLDIPTDTSGKQFMQDISGE